MVNFNVKALQVVLVLAGLFTVFVGINVAFGGILTLGLLGQTKFLDITDLTQYLVQDSHVRFFGGMYGSAGLLLLIGAINPRKFQAALQVVFILFFMGGLARFTMLRPDVVFGPAIIGSLTAELILMPILYYWVAQSGHSTASMIATTQPG